MDLLIDTHALLWFLEGNERLPGRVRDSIESANNKILVSVASLWEMTIKHSIGKLTLSAGIEGVMRGAFDEGGFSRLDIQPEHLKGLARLPYLPKPSGLLHKDPFDRLLVAQARAEGLPVATVETWWRGAYGVSVWWTEGDDG